LLIGFSSNDFSICLSLPSRGGIMTKNYRIAFHDEANLDVLLYCRESVICLLNQNRMGVAHRSRVMSYGYSTFWRA